MSPVISLVDKALSADPLTLALCAILILSLVILGRQK